MRPSLNESHHYPTMLSKMLFLSFSGTATVAFSGFLSDNAYHRVVRQFESTICSSDCATIESLSSACLASPDPYCGCDEVINNSSQCMACLTRTNTTLSCLLSAGYLSSTIALCKCQAVEACGQYIQAFRPCFRSCSDPLSLSCTCPVINKYLPDCAPCWAMNGGDAIATSLNKTLHNCQLLPTYSSTAGIPSTAFPTGTALPTSSPAPQSGALSAFATGTEIATWISVWFLLVNIVNFIGIF